MPDATTAYLAELERALGDLPRTVAGDILDGVREELGALDDAAARERIAELGDPHAIAAAASEELPRSTPVGMQGDPTWYTVLTILLVGVGAYAVPVVGWIVGIGFLWNSRTWTRRDKVVGTVILPIVALLALGITAVAGLATATSTGQLGQEAINPLVPAPFTFAHSALIATAVFAPIASAVYLLVRARTLRR